MKCSRCGHENPEGSKFCAQCGNQLARVCPVCSTPARPDDKFCSNCGNPLTGDDQAAERDHTRYAPEAMLDKIEEARSGRAMQGERRTVTMLFADIKGSTAAAENLDPEDWADIINGAFEHLIAPVYRYEGTLARLQGDAVLAFFGAPIAHEDDPIRAVRAGLDIVRRIEPYRAQMLKQWNIPVEVRVGINTGLVVVGAVGSDLKVEYTALGDAVNVAARMEQTAEPGTVRVTGETWALVSDQFEGDQLGAIEVKGKAEPVPAVRVISYHGLAPDSPSEQQPLIGRNRELELLDDLRVRLMEGNGCIASLMGEAGIGKTRLLNEVRKRALSLPGASTTREDADRLGWVPAFSQSYDSSVPYSTIRDLLVRWLKLNEADDPYQRIAEVAASVVPDAVHDPEIYLGYAAGIALPQRASDLLESLEPPVIHKRTREAVAAFLEGEALRRPVVVGFEDTHWADSMSLAVIEDLMEVTERAPLGLLVSLRPYRDEPVWRIHEVAERDHPHRYQLIDLDQLGAEETEEMLDELLDGTSVSEETRRTILERAGGNPLFIDQMARALRESEHDDDLAVPTGLSSLLTARLDRLEEHSRRVAQTASVIGSEFDRPTLASLLGDDTELSRAITDLLRRGIFVEKPDSARSLSFHHALVQDAAYSTMLLRTRRELHKEVAEHLIDVSPNSSQEIAEHLIQAGAGEEAFPYLVAAGESSSRSMALSDAIRFFTTALEHLPANADPELVVRAHDGLGFAYSLIPDLTQSGAAYQQLADYADSTDHPSAKVKALNRLAINTAMLAGDLAGAHSYLDDAYSIAKEYGDQLGLAEYHMNACLISGLGGDISSSIEHDEQIAEQGTTLGVDEIRVEGLGRLAGNSVWLMDFDRAEEAVEEAIRAAEETGDTGRLAVVKMMGLSRLRIREGDTESALQLLLESEEEIVRRSPFYAPMAGTFVGTLLYDRGDVETGISRIADVRRAVIEEGINFYVATTSAILARMYASLQLQTSLHDLRESALEAVQAPLGNYLASTVWAELGLANLASGDLEQADEDFASGLAASSATQYWERPRLLIGRAVTAVNRDDLAKATRDLDEAETIIQEKELRIYEADLRHARGKVLMTEDRHEEALDALSTAFESVTTMGLRPQAVQIAVTAAAAATAAGQGKVAAGHEATARRLAAEIAGSVVDDELRAAVETAWLEPLDQLTTG